jgi:hypothetical protein
MKQLKIIMPFAFLALLLLTACRKDVPKGAVIQAFGFVIDSVKNKRLPNVTIYLYGAHSNFYGVYYDVGPLDSTISDIDGNFSLEYSAEGTSIDYALAVGNVVYGGYTSQNNYVVDVVHPLYPFNYSRLLRNVALRARELNYARINLKVLSNPYDSLYLYISTAAGELFIQNLFIGASIDTSILSHYLPEALNTFQFEISSAQLLDSGMQIRTLTDSITAKMQDTITISQTFNSAYDIPLAPY